MNNLPLLWKFCCSFTWAFRCQGGVFFAMIKQVRVSCSNLFSTRLGLCNYLKQQRHHCKSNGKDNLIYISRQVLWSYQHSNRVFWQLLESFMRSFPPTCLGVWLDVPHLFNNHQTWWVEGHQCHSVLDSIQMLGKGWSYFTWV